MAIKTADVRQMNRNRQIFLAGAFALAAAVILAPAAVQSAGGGAHKPSDAVSFEEIEGSTVKRVILHGRAAERLGIELGEVSEETIVLKQMVGGLVIPPVTELPEPEPTAGMFSGFGAVTEVATAQPTATAAETTTSNEAWVLVTLSQGEWERIRKDQLARIVPLATRDELASDVFAMPSDLEPIQDMKRSMLKLHYIIPGEDHGLSHYDRVRVELQLSGSGKRRLTVPYSAVYYDGKGTPWVYVSTESMEFERQRIEVERIVGNLAVITEGPPIGTKVVTIGAAMLYGAEVIYKR